MVPQPKQTPATILLYSFIVIMGIMWCRLFYLQVICRDHLARLSTFNFLRMIKINPPRGNIVDIHGTFLATNKPIFTVYWQGTSNHKLTPHQLSLIQELSALLSFGITNVLLRDISTAERHQGQWLLANNISFQQLSFLAEHFCYEPNIIVQNDLQRHYPYQELASHAIGYLSAQSMDFYGKMGLEKLYEDELKGTPGFKKRTVNAIGKSLDEQDFQEYIIGKTIQTTIDLDMQQLAEQAFPTEDSGCMIVMDPQNGALRVLLSRPSFNPEMFLRHISTQEWAGLQETHLFINRACQACYPPASLFKLVTVAAALEQNIVSPNAVRVCPGYYMFHDRPYHCSLQTGHGLINFKQSLAQSCNIIFFEIGKKIDIDTLANYANRFGLGMPTGIVFPEKVGLIPTTSWKRANKGEAWRQGETLSVAIGQSFLLVTPMQITRMLGSIAQGYLVRPRILEEEPIERQPLQIQESTRTFLKKCMKAAIKYGTGKRVRGIPNMLIYGKTGTAQVSSLEKTNNTQECRSHGWFVANFIYKDHGPLTLVIMVEHAGGSHKPTCIAKQFLTKYQKYMSAQDYPSTSSG